MSVDKEVKDLLAHLLRKWGVEKRPIPKQVEFLEKLSEFAGMLSSNMRR